MWSRRVRDLKDADPLALALSLRSPAAVLIQYSYQILVQYQQKIFLNQSNIRQKLISVEYMPKKKPKYQMTLDIIQNLWEKKHLKSVHSTPVP